jgi:hypothetical protein
MCIINALQDIIILFLDTFHLDTLNKTWKLHLTEQIPSLLINDEEVKDPEVVADTFNTFFLAITETLNLHQEVRGDTISFLKESFPRKFYSNHWNWDKKYNTIPQSKKLIRLWSNNK